MDEYNMENGIYMPSTNDDTIKARNRVYNNMVDKIASSTHIRLTFSGLNFSLYLDKLWDNPKLIGPRSCAPNPVISSVS